MRIKPKTQGQRIADKILEDDILKEVRDGQIRSLENKISITEWAYSQFFKYEPKDKKYKLLKISEDEYEILVGIVEQHIIEIEESISQAIKVPSIMKAQLKQANKILEDLIIC